MLNTTSLSSIRGSAYRWLKDLCTIERDTDTLDELGSAVSGREIVASNVPCRIVKNRSLSNSAAAIIGQGESLTESYKIAIPSSYELDINYHITVGNVSYDVVNLETALTDEVFTQAIMTRHR